MQFYDLKFLVDLLFPKLANKKKKKKKNLKIL